MGVSSLDLTGETYGHWTVLYEVQPKLLSNGCKERMWHCLCACGNEKDVAQRMLRSGASTSCGCSRKLDLTNQKYGRLTALYEAEPKVSNGKTIRMWHCLCECGNEKDIAQDSLVKGGTKSCGCLLADSKKKNRIYNNLEGKKFGKWTVLHEAEPIYYSKGYPVRRWKCQCECGTIINDYYYLDNHNHVVVCRLND